MVQLQLIIGNMKIYWQIVLIEQLSIGFYVLIVGLQQYRFLFIKDDIY